MTRPPTKADLERKAAYWKEKYDELFDRKEKEIKEVNAQLSDWIAREQRNHEDLRTIRDLWNQWIEADKGLQTKEAYAVWTPETFAQLLSLLHP